ncbi:MAG: YceI family protein [Actinobacteria bacterium]|nr:YceI family protein [Actinomycetota bacterium]
MSDVTAQPFAAVYRAQSMASSFGFAVRHSESFWFRGRLPEVTAALRPADGGLALEGAAKVDSMSVVAPAELRRHLLGPEFFDAERHPEVIFRSTDVRLLDGGRLEVDGELTIKGIARPVAAAGHYSPPRQAAFGEVAGLDLQATIDRREFGFDWQAELPGGGDALGWEVRLEVDLLLMREDAGSPARTD